MSQIPVRYLYGRSYFAGLGMTSRRNNARDVRYVVLQYLLMKNEKRAKIKVYIYTSN